MDSTEHFFGEKSMRLVDATTIGDSLAFVTYEVVRNAETIAASRRGS